MAEGADAKDVYNQNVMDKVNELQQRGRLKGGFDRAGSSNSDDRDAETWPKIFKTQQKQHLYEEDDTKRKELIKSTYWFAGYQSAAKAQMKLECQNFDGTLEVICIQGGAITDAEHEEMERIIADAKKDAAMNQIQINIELKKVSYYDFLCEHDPASLTSEGPLPEHTAPELPQPANHSGAVDCKKEVQGMESNLGGEQVTALRNAIEQKDEVIGQKDKEIALLKEQLKKLLPSEGLPPDRAQ